MTGSSMPGQPVPQAEVGAEAEGHVVVGRARRCRTSRDRRTPPRPGWPTDRAAAASGPGMVSPWSSTSRVAVRAMFLIGLTQRSISSTASGRRSALGGQLVELVGMGEQLVHAAADDVAGRLVAADQDQQRLVDEGRLVEPVAVDLGVDQRADQVVGLVVPRRCSATAVMYPAYSMAASGGPVHGRRVGRAQRLQHVVGPPSRASRSSGATPSMLPITIMGSGAAMSLDEVGASLLAHPVDDGVADRRGCPPRSHGCGGG